MNAAGVRQGLYGVAAVAGLIGTWYFNLSYRGSQGYLAAWFANDAASSAAVDLIVVAVVLSVFMLAEGRRLGMRMPWLYVLLGFALAMAFAVPLFLLLRERTLEARGTEARGGTEP